jgi:hypothetical protein
MDQWCLSFGSHHRIGIVVSRSPGPPDFVLTLTAFAVAVASAV